MNCTGVSHTLFGLGNVRHHSCQPAPIFYYFYYYLISCTLLQYCKTFTEMQIKLVVVAVVVVVVVVVVPGTYSASVIR